jgi:hypothetical protein
MEWPVVVWIRRQPYAPNAKAFHLDATQSRFQSYKLLDNSTIRRCGNRKITFVDSEKFVSASALD